MKVALEGRPNCLGIYVATAYVFIVGGVYAVTAYNTKPDNVGYDWIPFVMLSMPWTAISMKYLQLGFILNAGILYLAGTLLEKLRRRIFWK